MKLQILTFYERGKHTKARVEEQNEVKMMMVMIKNKPLGIEEDESDSVNFTKKGYFFEDSERWMINQKRKIRGWKWKASDGIGCIKIKNVGKFGVFVYELNGTRLPSWYCSDPTALLKNALFSVIEKNILHKSQLVNTSRLKKHTNLKSTRVITKNKSRKSICYLLIFLLILSFNLFPSIEIMIFE